MTGGAVRTRLLALALAIVVAVGLTLYLVLGNDDEESAPNVPAPSGPLPTVGTTGLELNVGPPPWDPPLQAQPYIRAAGLEALPRETLDVHYHAHLDIEVDGEELVVPSGIGFVLAGGQLAALSPLHTHEIDGIVHIESPTNVPYTLGQLFAEWGVRFTGDCIGGLCTEGGQEWRVYVNGDRLESDPTILVFRAHQEIALWYGAVGADADVPSGYEFPPGL